MKIKITSRSENVTHEMRTYAEEKAEKLFKLWDGIISMEITLKFERERPFAEMKVNARRGNTLVATDEGEEGADITACVDLLIEKMERQIKKKKAKVRGKRRGRGPEVEPHEVPAEEAEETYEEIIEQMDL